MIYEQIQPDVSEGAPSTRARRRRAQPAILLLILGLGVPAHAETSAGVVKVSPGGGYKVRRGASVPAKVGIEIQRGYHVNSNRPTASFLIATALKWEPVPGLTTSAVTYPEPKLQKFGFSPTPLSVYEGKVELAFTLTAAAAAAAGSRVLKGSLRVQACNDQACLRPDTIPVTLAIDVVSPRP